MLCHIFKLSCSILIGNCSIMSPNQMLSQCYLSFLVNCLDIIDSKCCNYCHLLSDCSSKFQLFMTIPHHKLLTREGRAMANGGTHPSSMTVVVRLFIRNVIRKVTTVTLKYQMALNIILSSVVVSGSSLCYCTYITSPRSWLANHLLDTACGGVLSPSQVMLKVLII
jgi:hypothetical protein